MILFLSYQTGDIFAFIFFLLMFTQYMAQEPLKVEC